MPYILLFDSNCCLCDSSVQFILKRDEKGIFYFASLDGIIAKQLLTEHHISPPFDSFILIKNHIVYTKSTAVFELSKNLPYPWKLLSIFRLLPTFLTDPIYLFISKNRYKWFGTKDVCILPSKEHKHRFLD